MKYVDLHCDALTTGGAACVNGDTLRRGGGLLQCFAAFVSAREGRFSAALALCDKFDTLCAAENFQPVRRFSDIVEGKINALLTVEEGGAIEGDIAKLEELYRRGVRMMTLTWNYPNEIGFPCFPDYEGLKAGGSLAVRESARGLTSFGFSAVERMGEIGMIVDVSHGSDALVKDVAAACKTPFVASHSGADAVHSCARNLTDGGIRLIAEKGGVIGLDFCADFLSPDLSAEGQRGALLAHAKHILNAGGEDVLALGSDFDGIPENAYMKSPACVPLLLEEFERAFGARIAEKIARGNALRILKEVLG